MIDLDGLITREIYGLRKSVKEDGNWKIEISSEEFRNSVYTIVSRYITQLDLRNEVISRTMFQ